MQGNWSNDIMKQIDRTILTIRNKLKVSTPRGDRGATTHWRDC